MPLWTGIDALEAANHLLAALYTHRRNLAGRTSSIAGIGSPQLTVGLISGGTNTNVVPDAVTFRCDRRILPEEDPRNVTLELEAVIAGAARARPAARVVIERILLAEPLRPAAGGEKLTQVLCRRASEVMGVPVCPPAVPHSIRMPAITRPEASPSCLRRGPRTIEDANAHRADERLDVSVRAKAREGLPPRCMTYCGDVTRRRLDALSGAARRMAQITFS
jgi:acetylornithine deacetylase/succinyl-diaminopimelate desuccinylase-like protein